MPENSIKNSPILRLSIINSLIKTLTISLSFFLGVHYDNIGLTGSQIGMIFAIGILTSILTILPSGLSNDRIKSKHLVFTALILMGIMYGGISVAKTFFPIVILSLIGGMGTTLYTSSSDSLFYKTTNKENIQQKLNLFHGLNYLMIGIGMIVSGFLLENNISFEKLFGAFSITFFLMAIISLTFLPSTATASFKLIHYKKDLLRPKVLSFILILFLFAIHFGAESTSYGLFLSKTLSLNRFQMGLYMGVAIIVMAITVRIISKNLHKWKTQNILLAGLFISGSGHILITVQNPIISALFRIYHEIGDASMFFFLYYGIAKLFDLKRIGGNASIFSLTGTLGGALGAIVFGPMGSTYGYQYPLVISGITSLISFLLTLKFLKHFDHKYEPSINRP